MNNLCCIILCGGKSTRMGALSKKFPKNLLKIDKKNRIIDKQIKKVFSAGIKKIIFPTGYKHQVVKNYLTKNYKNKDFLIKNTGISSSIGERLKRILNNIKANSNILLINGDTLLDFNLKDIIKSHLHSKKMVTISTYKFETNFGLIKIKDNNIYSFEKKVKMKTINSDKNSHYVINAGISIINKRALDKFIFNDGDFEKKFYNYIIKKKQINIFDIKGKIFQFDTPKDLENFKFKQIKV